MTNNEKYVKVFVDSFNISEDQVPNLEYQSVPSWDSIGHMQLIAALEDIFGIMMDADDIVDLSSFEKGKEILKKYEIGF